MAARSIAFFSHKVARAESSMTTWATIALLCVLITLVIGGPS
jgi:hypothetical protein